MAKKPKPNWTPAMVQSPSKAVRKPRTPIAKKDPTVPLPKTEPSPVSGVKRGRPRKQVETGFLYLDADFYLVHSAEGYQEAAQDWWGEAPASLAKGPQEFPAVVAFFERNGDGPTVQNTFASRSSLGFTKEQVREVSDPQTIEKIVKVDKIVERIKLQPTPVRVPGPTVYIERPEPSLGQIRDILLQKVIRRVRKIRA